MLYIQVISINEIHFAIMNRNGLNLCSEIGMLYSVFFDFNGLMAPNEKKGNGIEFCSTNRETSNSLKSKEAEFTQESWTVKTFESYSVHLDIIPVESSRFGSDQVSEISPIGRLLSLPIRKFPCVLIMLKFQNSYWMPRCIQIQFIHLPEKIMKVINERNEEKKNCDNST